MVMQNIQSPPDCDFVNIYLNIIILVQMALLHSVCICFSLDWGTHKASSG